MKFLKYIILILAAFVWLSGLNQNVLNLTGNLRRFQNGYQFGDLYRLSNLPQFKDPVKACEVYKPHVRNASNRKVNLFVIGDSFTEPGRIEKANFPVDFYQYVHWDEFLHVKLDTTQTNILLIECVERHVREKFAMPMKNLVPDSATFVSNTPYLSRMQKLDIAFSSKGTEARLDMLLFTNNLVMQIREWKATLNYKFFDRVNKEVTLVNNDQDIVYYLDTNTPATTSSFTSLTKNGVDTIVTNVMTSEKAAIQLGFDEVILSIIPNKISVINPEYGTYNRLIDRVYSDPRLTLPVVNVLEDFRKMGTAAYLRGDSHWTCAGQNLWLEKANTLIGERIATRR